MGLREYTRLRGRTDWEARQFIRNQYESGERNFYAVFDFYSIFTEIEFQIWVDIQSFNLPLCPQYPVGKYFADFGDPDKHLAIECDGKDHNKAKDDIRDKFFASQGWTVIRIKGRDCFGETGTRIIRGIAEQFYGYPPLPERKEWDEEYEAYEEYNQ